MSRRSARTRDRGFILLIVLWSTAFIALLGTQVVTRARGEANVAIGARDAAVLQAAADGAVEAAIFRLLSKQAEADAVPRSTRSGPITLTTTISNEAGLVNPNLSPVVLMTSLLHVLGLQRQQADDLATAIALWRSAADAVVPQYRDAGRTYGPNGTPFMSIDELGMVLGMTPELLDRLRPHLSLFLDGDIDARYADPVVAAALDDTGVDGTPLSQMNVRVDELLARITVQAVAASGRRSTRVAEVRFVAHPDTGAPDYAILSWEDR